LLVIGRRDLRLLDGEVKFPDGKTQVQRISVTVGAGSPGRRT
jgi:hypothetical protein